MEEWKEIEGFDGRYLISSEGRVIDIKPKIKTEIVNLKGFDSPVRFLKLLNHNYGYSLVRLSCGIGIDKGFTIHRLVANAFLPNPLGKSDVNHIDGNKKNNHMDNLEWVSSKENTIHAVNSGITRKKKGSKHLKKDEWDIVLEIYRSGLYSKYELAKFVGVSYQTLLLRLKG